MISELGGFTSALMIASHLLPRIVTPYLSYPQDTPKSSYSCGSAVHILLVMRYSA